MDFKTLFFSWDGRSPRKPYWIGIVVVEVATFALAVALVLMGVPEIIAALVIAYPRICVVTKRLHDINRSGWLQVLPNMLSGVMLRLGPALNRDGASPLTDALLSLLGFVIAYGFIIWLGCVKGQDRNNDFGPAPGAEKLIEVF